MVAIRLAFTRRRRKLRPIEHKQSEHNVASINVVIDKLKILPLGTLRMEPMQLIFYGCVMGRDDVMVRTQH